MNKLPAGSKLTCPSCDLEVAILLHDLFRGEKMDIIKWKPLQVEIKASGLMLCPDCGAQYGRNTTNGTQVHIHGMGWV